MNSDAILRRPLVELPATRATAPRELDRLVPQVDAAAFEPHAVENARDERFHAREVGEHAVDQRALIARATAARIDMVSSESCRLASGVLN